MPYIFTCVACGKTTTSSGYIHDCPFCIAKERTPEDRAFDEIERKQNEAQAHPLLNPESTHYSMIDGVEAITRLEGMFSEEEMMIWSKITAMKYRLRIGNKDDVLKEAKKIETYEAYYKYLEEK